MARSSLLAQVDSTPAHRPGRPRPRLSVGLECTCEDALSAEPVAAAASVGFTPCPIQPSAAPAGPGASAQETHPWTLGSSFRSCSMLVNFGCMSSAVQRSGGFLGPWRAGMHRPLTACGLGGVQHSAL